MTAMVRLSYSRLSLRYQHCIGILVHSSEVKERLSALEVGVKAERARPTIVYPPTPPLTDYASSQYSKEPPSRDALGVATVSSELSLEVLNGKDGLRKRSFGASLPSVLCTSLSLWLLQYAGEGTPRTP